MKEIISHMESHGFSIPDLELDGKVHRFKVTADDAKNSGWYCGFQNFTAKAGQVFYVVRYGNFKTGVIHQFQSEGEFTEADKKTIKENMEKAKKKGEAERRIIQEAVATECVDIWDKLDSGEKLPDYLVEKKIEKLYGTRTRSGFQGRDLFVPMRDAEGRLWSMQKIQPDRAKFFQPGGRVAGCFHTLGDIHNEETIYLAEGFATAASIHAAIGKCVVSCFTSVNLVTVAQILKIKYPEKMFVVCGDDDIWTEVNGEAKNPGREKAEEAAKKIMGVTVFPKFKTLEKGKTTDFNDLHVREGIGAVKDQLSNAKPEKHFIVALGYNESDYYFLSNINPQIQRLSAASLCSASGLCRLQPLTYWENQYPAKNENGVSWTAAADHLMQECHSKGIFRPDKVRGKGVWNDDGRTVYHMGDRLHFEKKEHPLHRNSLRSKYIYESSDAMPPLHSQPLTVEECLSLVGACDHVRWKKKESARFFAGWLAVSSIGGSLSWRPHIWVTGPSGSGKSYVMQEITYPLFENSAHFFLGKTSEAGIRQSAGRSTIPVIFDEFETDDERSGERVKTILALARQASSESNGVIAMGTVSGEAINFKPMFSMMVASVRINLTHEEDQNRFAVLELARGAGDQNDRDQFEMLQEYVKDLGPEYGRRLFSRMLSMAETVRASAAVLQRVIAERYPMRIGQQYGALLAGYWALISDEVITEEKSRQLRDTMDFSVVKSTVGRSDELECLDYLLQTVISVDVGNGDRVERSVYEMIKGEKGFGLVPGPDFNLPLQRVGILRDGDFVCIDRRHRSLSNFYRGTKWASNYADQLGRIKEAIPNKRKRFPGTSSIPHCVFVPVSQVFRAEEPENT